MKRLLLSLSAVFAIGACSDTPTTNTTTETAKNPDFILFGTPDANDHPHVGLLLFYDENGPAWFCTGTALDPNTILTAGHCTEGATVAHWYQMEKRWTRSPV